MLTLFTLSITGKLCTYLQFSNLKTFWLYSCNVLVVFGIVLEFLINQNHKLVAELVENAFKLLRSVAIVVVMSLATQFLPPGI